MTDKPADRSDTKGSGLSPADRQPSPAEPVQAGQADPQRETVDMQAFIGRQLRAVYDDVAKQPIPDRFIELMNQLDRKVV